MTNDEIRDLQRALNGFTAKYLKGVEPLKVDGVRGKATNSRVMAAKWYLGYGEDRDGKVTPEFLNRMAHPKSSKYAPRRMRSTGANRRRKQRRLASKPKPQADDALWAGSRYFTNRAVQIAAKHGIGISRRKWSGAPINGNWGSDHNVWNETADAVDLPTYNGEQVAREIAAALGAVYTPGSWNVSYVTHNLVRYRIQILFRAPDGSHGDHIHVGAKRA